MTVLFLEWNSFCALDMIEAFQRCGHSVYRLSYEDGKDWEKQRIKIEAVWEKETIDAVFTFNYFPDVSDYCMEKQTKYIAWVYDCPYLNILSYTTINPCNYIFLFDYGMYQMLHHGGISTVHYLPLAANSRRLDGYNNIGEIRKKYSCDVSFVGSLYTEKKHNFYARFEKMDAFCKGYMDGIINAQLHIYGQNLMQDLVTDNLVNEMQKFYPTDPNGTTIATPEYIYAEYVLNRRVTALERRNLLEAMSDKMITCLYTHEKNIAIGNVENRGPVDYYDVMPYVFKNSKVNLNITLRSIKTGIPLRAFDIMGCGGFLLSNYQEEFLEYFEPNRDFVYYSDVEDAVEKAKFYYEHEDARRTIAVNGHKKVAENHTFEDRVKQIEKVILTE